MLTRADIRIPRGWHIEGGADTGTYLGGCIAAINPVSYDLYVLEEIDNYRYTGDGTIEETGETVGEWIRRFAKSMTYWTGKKKNGVWVDANTTFKTEVGHGLRFRMNHRHLELRTEITREYVRNNRIHLAPWLKNLPYEMEEAHFPEDEPQSGRKVRVKVKDHDLDGLEHICSRRPHPKFRLFEKPKTRAIEQFVERHKRQDFQPTVDPHLGQN